MASDPPPRRFLPAAQNGIYRKNDTQLRGDIAIKELCRKHGFSDAVFYTLRRGFGGMEVADAKRLKALEAENAKLKKLLAESLLDVEALKVALGRKP